MKFLNAGSVIGSLSITSAATNVPNLTLTKAAGQTAPFLSVLSETGTTLAFLTSGGALSATSLALTTTPLAVSSGGTSTTATPTSGGIAYGSGTSYVFTSAGTSGQVLGSNGAGAPTWQTLDLTYLPGSWAKKSVRAATTANITLSAPQTVDGIALVAGDRVLVKNQTTASQNGIYVVAAAAWTRATDAATSGNIASAIAVVDTGTASAGMTYTTNFKPTDTIGTTAMNWYRMVDDSQRNAANGYAGLDAASGLSISGALSVTGDLNLGQTGAVTGTAYLSSTTDANQYHNNTSTVGSAGTYPPLIIGNKTGQHLRMDNNEVISILKDDGTITGTGLLPLGPWGFTGTAMSFTVNGVNIYGQSASAAPLTVRGFTGQSANVLQVQSVTGTNFLTVNNGGDVVVLGQMTAAQGFFTGTVSAANLNDSGVITSGIVTAASGFTVTSQKLRQVGAVCTGEFQVTFNNAVSVPADGNIANVVVMTLAAQYRSSTYFHLMNGNGGSVSQFYCTTAGNITFGATTPGTTIPAGLSLMILGTWLSDTF